MNVWRRRRQRAGFLLTWARGRDTGIVGVFERRSDAETDGAARREITGNRYDVMPVRIVRRENRKRKART